MFISVQSCILLGSWCCLCTYAARKTRSSNGVSYIFLTSSFVQSWRVGGTAAATGTLVVVCVAVARERDKREDRVDRDVVMRSMGVECEERMWLTKFQIRYGGLQEIDGRG